MYGKFWFEWGLRLRSRYAVMSLVADTVFMAGILYCKEHVCMENFGLNGVLGSAADKRGISLLTPHCPRGVSRETTRFHSMNSDKNLQF